MSPFSLPLSREGSWNHLLIPPSTGMTGSITPPLPSDLGLGPTPPIPGRLLLYKITDTIAVLREKRFRVLSTHYDHSAV